LKLDCLVWIICFPCSVTSSLAFGTVFIERLKITAPNLERRGSEMQTFNFL